MNQEPTAGTTGAPAAPPRDLPGNQTNTAADSQPDYTQPVAYDTEGRPLYLHPQAGQPAPAEPAQPPAFANEHSHGNHQYVHVSRPISPSDPEIPPDIMKRYEDSRRRFPHLNLSRGEFIISAIKRHPIGVFQIWFIAIFLILLFGGLMVSFLADGNSSQDFVLLASAGLGVISILVALGAFVATYVYNNNRFYLTNESVIQEIQVSLFSKHEQTVSLANIEDASYRQDGVLPQMLNYGLIRLSTEGDETTYRFNYVSDPKRQIAILNNAVEAFKNGRPVLPPDDKPIS